MNGLMMQQELLISSVLRHAARHHADVEIVSRRIEGDIHRETFHDLQVRAKSLAHALSRLGVVEGDRVATLAWNGHRHVELYYAVSGMGAVLHTINPRLHVDQLVYMANHAEDQVLFFDALFLPLVQSLRHRLRTVRHFVVLTDRAHMPETAPWPDLHCFEALLEDAPDSFEWPALDENTASSLCYTSGTTGEPKGVLYSHRSSILHSFAGALQDGLNVNGMDTVLPIVPMFHVNAWGLPYIACMVGAKLVLPGPALDGASLYDLIESEGVTVAAGVPTVWQGLLTYMENHGLRFSTLKRTIIGGSACPPAMMLKLQENFGVQVSHAWGMTETSPLGVSCTFKPKHAHLSREQRYQVQAKQGHAPFGVDIKIVAGDGRELAWDGRAAGELHVRGLWVASSYFRAAESPLVDGWFPTGDMCTIDPDGYVQITDRSKDVIKSGGEWISSIELESIAVGHEDVAMAACIAVPHPRWDERPLLLVVRKPEATVTSEELLMYFEGKVPKWWRPDDVIFVDAMPLGATGKIQKNKLREQFLQHQLPNA